VRQKADSRFWKRGGVTLGYIAAIYAFLPFSSGVMLSLNATGLLPLLITVTFLATAVVTVALMLTRFRIVDSAAYFLMAAAALVVGYFIVGLEVPQERIHFIQYGLLVVAVMWTLEATNLQSRGAIFLIGILITAAVGLGDELIQGVVPGRYFDWRDVGFNGLAATVGAAVYDSIRIFATDPDQEWD